jgi:DNA-directed RNA polymerase specialized sigma24 family protein
MDPEATRDPTPAERNERIAEQILEADRGHLLAVARLNTDFESDAEEALQDAFAIFLDSYDPIGGAEPVAWITLTLKRRCWAITTAARHRRHPADVTELSQTDQDPTERTNPSTEHVAEVREEAEQIGLLLRLLKPDQREALTLLALGYSYREISILKDWTYTKVDRSIKEGRASLRAAREEDAA